MYTRLHVKYSYCCQILTKLEFSPQISKNTEISNFLKPLSLPNQRLMHQFLQNRLPYLTNNPTRSALVGAILTECRLNSSIFRHNKWL